MQRTALVLRYGIGPLRMRSRDEAAGLLDLPRGRVRLLERRGLRALADFGDGTTCAASGVSRTTLLAVSDLLTGTSVAGGEALPASIEAGVGLASAATVALDEGDGTGAVAGVRESGEERQTRSSEPEEDGPVASAGPSQRDPFGDNDAPLDDPLLIGLLAIVVASLASAAGEMRRALR